MDDSAKCPQCDRNMTFHKYTNDSPRKAIYRCNDHGLWELRADRAVTKHAEPDGTAA